MTLNVQLQVALKGADLVASTAWLTLNDKLGYVDKLLSIIRLDSFAFAIECEDAENTLETLKRSLAVRTTFYNRNKHNYFLQCAWDGDAWTDGIAPDTFRRRLAREAAERLKHHAQKDLDSQVGAARVILSHVPGEKVFRSEVLVQDVELAARAALARRLESELVTSPVTVSELGTRWLLALRAESIEDAEAVTREIVVTTRRDRGLLLNPNHQGFTLLSLEPIDLTEN